MGHVLYAIATIPSADIHARLPRKLQSEAAAKLAARLSGLAGLPGRISKSHSRAVVAVASADAEVSGLGIDVEWMRPDRPFDAILRSFAPTLAGAVDADAFYRAWTYLEAHFKAWQRWPGEAEIEEVLVTPPSVAPWQTRAGNQILQQRVAGDFQLTVLWQCRGPCSVQQLLENPV
jgi:hypothetical protein